MNILFVCTGNTCRSPMAEIFFRVCCGCGKEQQIRAKSAGVSSFEGAELSMQAAEALRREGISPVPGHLSHPVGRDLVDWADLVVPMTKSHLQNLVRLFPDAAGKCRMLMSFAGEEEDVSDPFGGSIQDYTRCLAFMKPALLGLWEYAENAMTEEGD